VGGQTSHSNLCIRPARARCNVGRTERRKQRAFVLEPGDYDVCLAKKKEENIFLAPPLLQWKSCLLAGGGVMEGAKHVFRSASQQVPPRQRMGMEYGCE
jgi:hypothetical protein